MAPPVLQKYAGVKSWSAFERGMLYWSIEEKDGVFRISGQSKQADGMWRDDPEQTIIFPAESTIDDVIDRMISIMRDAAGSDSKKV